MSCPAAATIGVRGRFFYPPTFPFEDEPDPLRCFRTIEQARAAGFVLAPTPRGALLMGGVYLVPVPAGLRAGCARAAAALGFSVACPGLVPAPANGVERVPQARDEFLLEEQFAAPPGYVGAGTVGRGTSVESIGHLWIDSINRPLDAAYICASMNPPRSTRASVRGKPARFVSCPLGSSTHSGHVVLFWQEAGSWYLVSLHGHSALNRRLDMAIADSERLVA